MAEARKGYFKSYTEQEKQQLARTYTPEQVAAIEAAEAAIDPADLATQAAPRRDYFKFDYLEDFSRVEPTIDKRASTLRGEGDDYENVTDYARFTQPEHKMQQIAEALLEPGNEGEEGLGSERDSFAELWAKATTNADDMPINDSLKEAFDFDTGENRNIDVNTMIDATNAALQQQAALAAPPSASASRDTKLSTYAKLQQLLSEYDNHPDPPSVAPTLPKINDPGVRWESPGDDDPAAADDETAVAYARLSKAINQPVEKIRSYRTKTLVTHRVVNQTRLGKISSIYFLVVAGDEKGLVGLGEGKAAEGDEASRVARLNAIRNMKPVRRYEGRTVYGEVKGKSGAAEVTLAARPPGFGLRVSSHVFEIARCAGLHDLHARSTRSREFFLFFFGGVSLLLVGASLG